MSQQQLASLTGAFISQEAARVENEYQEVFRKVSSALQNDAAVQAREQLSDFYAVREQLSQALDVADLSNGRKAAQVYFCQIKALTDLLDDVAGQEQERQDAEALLRRYKHLRPCLEAVSKHPNIPGTELQACLGLHASNFSNFMKRVEPYRFFHAYSAGTTKYYALTRRGERCLSSGSRAEKAGQTVYPEKFVLSLLSGVADAFREGEQDADAVLLEASLQEPDVVLCGSAPLLRAALRRVMKEGRRSRVPAPDAGARFDIYGGGQEYSCLIEAKYSIIEDEGDDSYDG